jgi:hypothetical protein
MADATQAGIDAAAAAIGAAIVGVTGVDAHTLFYTAAGASLGMTVAPPCSRMRAAALFVSVVLFCSLMGDLAAFHYFRSDYHYRWGIAAILAAVFHPLFQALTASLPSIFDWLLKRAGVKQ